MDIDEKIKAIRTLLSLPPGEAAEVLRRVNAKHGVNSTVLAEDILANPETPEELAKIAEKMEGKKGQV
jgi:hypothetical protein